MSPEVGRLDEVRADLRSILVAAAPASWDVRAGLTPLRKITRPTVLIDYREISPAPAVGAAFVRCTFDVLIVDHHTDQTRAEDAIDVDVVDMLIALSTHRRARWTSARKTEVTGTPYLGWLLGIDMHAQATPTPEETP